MKPKTWGSRWLVASVGLLALAAPGCMTGGGYPMQGPVYSPGMQAYGNQPYGPGMAYRGGPIQQVGYQPGASTLPPPVTSEGNGYHPMPSGVRPGPGMVYAGPTAGMPLPLPGQPPQNPDPPVPRELIKSVMPPYVIEPPDTVHVEVLKAIPKPPYRVEPLDVLLVTVPETLPGQPINGTFMVSPDGLISLGYSYGIVRVAGLALDQVPVAIKLVLKSKLNDPQVSVALASFRGQASLRGDFMLAQDGTISLGTYGCVPLAGLTLPQARAVLEKHLSNWLLNPEVSINVTGYNSKVYYVIFDGAGFGQQIYRFPITGNETVLDAIANLQGLPAVASQRRIWLARPAPMNQGCYTILPVNWEVITQAGDTATNWQLFPGDRIYVDGDPWIKCDNTIAKVMAPIERVLGITLLGTSVWSNVHFATQNFNNNNGTAFIPVTR
jgi:polysaccharide export outer membrane protein